MPELWDQASAFERMLVRHFAPLLMASMFDSLVQPGVHRTVGLPGWRTWNAVLKSEARRQLRADASVKKLEWFGSVQPLTNAGGDRRIGEVICPMRAEIGGGYEELPGRRAIPAAVAEQSNRGRRRGR